MLNFCSAFCINLTSSRFLIGKVVFLFLGKKMLNLPPRFEDVRGCITHTRCDIIRAVCIVENIFKLINNDIVASQVLIAWKLPMIPTCLLTFCVQFLYLLQRSLHYTIFTLPYINIIAPHCAANEVSTSLHNAFMLSRLMTR